MKKFLSTLLLISTLAFGQMAISPGRRTGAIAYNAPPAGFTVVHEASTSTFGSSITVTIPSTTAGNTLLVWFANRSSTTLGTTSDNKSSTYTQLTSTTTGSTLQTFVASNIAAGITSVTVTDSGFVRLGIVVAEVSGLPTSSPQDIIGSYTYGFSSGGNTGAITTTNANDEIMGVLFDNNSGDAWTSSDCTLLGTINDTTLSGGLFIWYKTETTTGSYSCNTAFSSGSTVSAHTESYK